MASSSSSSNNNKTEKLYTVSRMLEIVKGESEASGVEVEVKKKMSDGAYIPVEDEDIDMADFDVKLKQVVEHVGTLPPEEKKAFSIAMRDAGNDAFYEEDYKSALEMYAQAMAGLDGNREEVALPIFTNMAFCFLVLRKPKLALKVCDEALAIDPSNGKAHFRKGKALAALDRYAEAKDEFDQAGPDPATARELRALARTAKRVRVVRAKQRDTFAKALTRGAIYDDKDPREARRARAQEMARNGNHVLAAVLAKEEEGKKALKASSSSSSLKGNRYLIKPLVWSLVFVAALSYVFLD